MLLRIVSSLAIVGVTLATAAFSDEASESSVVSGSEPTNQTRRIAPHSHSVVPILRVAQKSPAKRKAVPEKGKGGEAEPASKPQADPTEKGKTSDQGGLKFSTDIAPLLVANCVRCHNERGATKNGKLDLSTFDKLKKGGASGPSFVAGMPEESHLYLRLTGDETPKMPRGTNDPLSEGVIQKVGDWIKAGARLDSGLDPKALLTSYAASEAQLRDAALAKLSVSERDKLVETKGLERWKKGSPKETPQVVPGKNFMAFGLLPKDRMNSLLRVADAQYPQILSLIAPEESRQGVQKIGIYVFNEKSQFVEFIRSVESRELSQGDQGSADLEGSEPYVAVLDPFGGREEPASTSKRSSRSKRRRRDDSAEVDRSLGGLVTDTLTTAIAKREGEKCPAWLSLGLGSYFGSRLDPRSPHTQQLRRAAFQQFELGWNTKATEALGGEGKPETIRAIGFGIIEALATEPSTRPALPEFVRSVLKQGGKLDDAIKNSFGTDRENFLEGTAGFVGTHYGRLR